MGEADVPQEDEVWRDIVRNFGERAHLEEPEEPEERYVPEPPPPAPALNSPRALAWLGVTVGPALLVTFAIARWSPPSPVDLLLVGWVLVSLAYLFRTMPRNGERDPWDDGSRV